MTTKSKALETLGSVWLFADLDQRLLERLAAVAIRKKYQAETEVVHQGDTDGDLYLVIKGLLQVAVQTNEQRGVALNLLRPGDVCGELSLLDGRGRSATISTVQPTELLLIHRSDFMAVLASSPELAIRMLQTMAGHVRRLTSRFEDLSVLPVPNRLAKKLLEIGELCGTPLDRNRVALPRTLSQQDLADHVQAARESVCKCMAKWSRAQVVYRTQTQIVINDVATLRALSSQFLQTAREPVT